MARTAPVPDIPPIPGMCPSVAVLAGGGDAGGGGGDGAGNGDGSQGAGAGAGGEAAGGDGRGAPDYDKHPECGYASHPVDVVTGRAFTHPITDLYLPGPLDFDFRRMYSAKAASRDVGLGFGWAHSLGWEVTLTRRVITVWNEQGAAVDFPMIPAGSQVIGPWGWVLRRESWGFAVDAGDGLWRLFSESDDERRWRLTAIDDRNRNRIAITYDSGHLVEVKDSAGRTIRFKTTREGRISDILVYNAASLGRWVTVARYVYDDAGNLAAAMDGDGFSARYAYDADHRLVEDHDRAGLTFHFRYDGEGRCIESWGDYEGGDPSLSPGGPATLADGVTRAKGIHHCRFEYHPDGYSEVTDSTQTRRYFGNEHGLLDKRVEGGGVVTATYDHLGHLLTRTDQLGATTSYERDARGRVLSITDPLGNTSVFRRGEIGLPIEVLSPNGGVTIIERDRFGNMTSARDPLGGTSVLRYDDRGLVTEVVDARGFSLKTEHDAQGNPITVTTQSGAVWRFAYDAFGRRLSEIDPTGAETRYTYSTRGDLTTARDPAGGVTVYMYDGERHLVQIVDPKGRITKLVWGGYHKLCERVDPSGASVKLRYNREGELTAIENELGERHTFAYDTSGVLISERTFDNRTYRYKNDVLGRPVRIEDGLGRATVITYDAAGRVTALERWDGGVEAYTHDANGDVVGVAGPFGELVFERDWTGRVIREVLRAGGEEHAIESAYDADGNRVRRTTSLGFDERITRDGAGMRLRTLLDGRTEIEHTRDSLGREVARLLPRGGAIESEFDPLGRLTRRWAVGPALSSPLSRRDPNEPAWLGPRDGGAVVDTRFRYDAGAELVEADDGRRGPTRFEYDPVGRLLARVPERARSELFRYDLAHNLYDGAAEPEPRVYGPGGRLLQKGDTSYVWDDDGHLVEKRVRPRDGGRDAVHRYTWNAAGMLASIEDPSGRTTAFVYDPLARRIEKRTTARGATGEAIEVSRTRFLWDGETLVHAIRHEASASGDPVVYEKTYTFDDDDIAPLAESIPSRPGAERSFLHHVTDPTGAADRLLAEDGSIACELDRLAFGRAKAKEGARVSTDLRLAGQIEDEETGLHYNRFRYFDPETGTFLSADPLGIEAGIVGFGFEGAPTTTIDPLGLAKMSLNEIRQAYNDEVKQVGVRAKARLCAGEDPEAVARDAHRERREIGMKYKKLTPWPKRLLIYARNIAPKWMGGQGYDSIYGPSYEQLRRRGKTPEQIIESSSRPNDKINKKYGVK